ncbi:DNA polymerase-like protein PA0670 [plant metagenome]|uniref:DNA polymerase-like protein PA0670 n=1 Tax=plant metagenome TaxID=1297885 RepID=A0A484PKT1_9ZZZZ
MLDACRTRWLSEPAAWALLSRERIVACSAGARALGLAEGMRRSGASTLAPQATLLERDVASEQALFDAAALAVLPYTPQVAQYADHTLLLDVTASLTLFGGPRALLRATRQAVRACGLQVQAALAPTPHGAWLLARHAAARARRATLKPATLSRRLDALPCALLPEAEPLADWLGGIGCHTLGALRALPRAGLQRRSSPALMRALDAAYAPTPLATDWFVPPPSYHIRHDLLERLEHSEGVLHVAARLLEGLCRWLQACRLAVTGLRLTLIHERRRHAGPQEQPDTRLALALAEPAWQLPQLLAPLRERYARLPWAGPVVALQLDTQVLAPQAPPSAQLFPDPGGSPADFRRLLDLLRARLGDARVLHGAAVADHRPENANVWAGADTPPCRQGLAPTPGERPFWLLDVPQPLPLQQDRPVHGTPLRLVRGPERIESGWWHGAFVLRDYFVAEDAHAARYWIFRERGQAAPRWFLHGLFA